VQISISARHGQLSDATRDKISAKLEKLPRIFERLTSISVTVDLEHKDMPTVDLRVSAEHKHDFVANDQSSDLMASMDGALHKLEQQLRKYKQRVQGHHKKTGTRPQGSSPETESPGS